MTNQKPRLNVLNFISSQIPNKNITIYLYTSTLITYNILLNMGKIKFKEPGESSVVYTISEVILQSNALSNHSFQQ